MYSIFTSILKKPLKKKFDYELEKCVTIKIIFMFECIKILYGMETVIKAQLKLLTLIMYSKN